MDDGPLRDMNDPENAEFLDSVKRGLVKYLAFTAALKKSSGLGFLL